MRYSLEKNIRWVWVSKGSLHWTSNGENKYSKCKYVSPASPLTLSLHLHPQIMHCELLVCVCVCVSMRVCVCVGVRGSSGQRQGRVFSTEGISWAQAGIQERWMYKGEVSKGFWKHHPKPQVTSDLTKDRRIQTHAWALRSNRQSHEVSIAWHKMWFVRQEDLWAGLLPMARVGRGGRR